MTETAEFTPTHTIGPIPVQRIEQEWPKDKAGWRPGKKLFPKFLDRFGNQIYTRKGLSAVPVGGAVVLALCEICGTPATNGDQLGEPCPVCSKNAGTWSGLIVEPEEPFSDIPVFVTEICPGEDQRDCGPPAVQHDAFEEPLLEFLDVDVAQAVFRAAAWPIFDEATGYAETMSGASAEVKGKTADGAKVVHVCVQGKWSRVLVPRLVPFQVLPTE